MGEDDTVYYTKFLDIALVHNGEAVAPQAPVQVTVELLDADEAAELGLQVVHFGLGGAEAVASSLNGDGAVTFETESFSPFGFTSILSTLMSWTDDLFSFSLLGVSSLFSPRYTPAALPTLEEGLEALEAYTVSSTGLLGSLTGLFVKISRSAALALGTLESVTVYGLKDGAAGAVLTEDLGTEAQTLSLSGADGFVMVHDTGYRRFNFELDNVTLNGMMPKASEAVAADVGEAYAVFTPEGEDAFEALAAYDISISSGGEEYQPDAEHPVAVSIALPDEAQDLDPEALEVWHVRDDGTKERVEDITVENGRVRFEATGFSVYVVTGYVLETTIDIEGQTYKVTATYDDNAGLPGDAKLSVSEVSVDDPRYVTYLNDTAEALGVSAGELGYLRLLDIAIVGEDGTKFTPNDQVKVTVELIDEIETGDLRVVHFGAETEEIAAETEGDTVTFTTDSFSVFSFVDLTLVQSVVDAVFGSTYTDKIYENDDIIVSGRMPRTAIVEVNPAEVEIEGADVLVAYDIKIYAGVITKALGIAWQPTDGALRVQMKSDAIDVENVDVYHMADANSEAELVAEEVAVEENTVFFEASAFSIYTVINNQPPRRTYSFYTLNDQDQYVPFYFRTDSGEETYQQIIKNGESLTVPELPSIDSDTTTFAGWYVFTPNSGATVPPVPGTNGTLAAESFNFNAIPAVTVDGEEVILCARFSSFIYAIFHEQYNGSTQTWPILATRRGEVNSNTATIQISDLKVSYDDTISNDPNDPNPVATQKAFRGWSYDQQTEQNPNPTVITGDSITISQNVNLYPVFVSINWLTYQSGPVGSGATYCAPVFYYVDEGATRFPIPVRVGYTFDGWYTAETGGVRLDSNTIVTETTEGGETVNYHGLNTSANLTGSADFEIVSGQLHLKQDATIYAHWTEASTKYSIVIWRQSVNDDASITKTPVDYNNWYNGWYQTWYDSWSAGKTEDEIKEQLNDALAAETASREVNEGYDRIKSYDFAESFDLGSTTGVSVSVAQVYKQLTTDSQYNSVHTEAISEENPNPYNGFSFSACDSTKTVANNGSTVLNVYYDRNVHTLQFQVSDFSYTETTSNTGAQYGFVDGIGYVQLTRNGSNPYTWTYGTGEYGYSYTASNSTSSGYYYIPDGNGGYEYVYLNRSNGRFYRQLDEYIYEVSTSTSSGNYYIPNGNGGYDQVYLYYNNGKWYRNRFGWIFYSYSDEYTGTRYERYNYVLYSGQKYTRSQTETMATYDGTRYTRSSNTGWQTIYTITGLFGASIKDHFPITGAGGVSYNGYIWEDQSSPKVYDFVLSTIETMPDANVVFHGKARSTEKTIYYYVEVDQNQSERFFNNKYYKLYKTVSHNYNYITFEEEYHPITGYTRAYAHAEPTFVYNSQRGGYAADIGSENANYLYYDRATYRITFTDSFTQQSVIVDGAQFGNVDVKYTQNLASFIPDDPTPVSDSSDPTSVREGYQFTGWYADSACSTRVFFEDNAAYQSYSGSKVLYEKMPAYNLQLFAGWATVWYRIEIDPNYGELTGSQSTFFWEPYNGDPIREYETVTRNYVPSINGTWYFYSLDRDYYGLGDEWDEIEDTISDRGAGYTQDINHPGVDLSVRYEAQTDAYRYANWYEVKPDGSETLYKFGEPVNHDTKLRLHWKQVGTYYLRYDAGAGSLDAGDSNEDTFKVLDSADYVDRSYVVVNRTANAPAGKNFIGWRVRGGGTTIYYPGQVLEFNAQYAVTEIGSDGVERRYIVMDAVYSELETADLVYDANDGVVIADQVDWGTSLAEQGGGLPTTKTTTSTRASLLGVQNNTGVVLSNGSGFSNGSLTLRGWNTQRDGHGTHFDLGDTVYLDTAGENVLFAEWEVKVYFYLNNERGDWNGTWPTGFVLDSVNNRYIYAMLANNSVPYPRINPVQPSVSGVEDQQFQYWSRERYLNSAPPQYNFSTPVTHDLQLYAYWAAPKQVPIHVVDASSETLVNKDAQWRTASFCVVNGTVHFESTSDAAVYTNIPSGYRYAFATASRTLDSISENDRIDYIYYNSNDEHAVWVHYHDGRDEALSSDREVYLIYFEDPQYLTINYLLMSNEGLLNPQTVNSSAPTQATLGLEGYDMKAAISAPMSWADAPANQITNYTYAVGMPLPAGETVDHARYLRVISDVSGNDTSRPDFKLRHTWRGYEYSVNDGASWTNCGYDIRLCVIYYKQFPITVRVHELTRGLEQDETKRFTYHVTIAQTVSTNDTVKVNGGANQEGASETWTLLDYYEFTLADDEDQAYSVFFQQRTPSGTETVNGKTWAFANPGASKITLTQTITITQTADTDFTTTNTIAPNAGANGTYSYTFTSYNNAPDQVATYTNVRTQMKVELHVAEAYGEPLLLRDELRVSNPAAYHVTIPINNRAALAPTGSEVQLPVNGVDFFPRHNDTDHIFGGLFYGVVNEGVATVTHDRITAVSFEQISGSSFYGVYVYFQDGTRELMDESHYIFYGYYYLPTIVYMRENYDGSLSRINPIEANGSAVTLNGGTVTQDAVLALNYVAGQQGATFTISQASGTGYFHVPPTLDGESTLSLDYSRLAVNGSGITSVNDPSLRFAEDKVIMLRFQQNGPMEYSIDGGVTWSIPPDVPVVYVIYREKGHDLTIRKNVDGPSTYQAQTFTGVVISNLLTKSEYAVTVHNPNGTTTETTTTAIGARVTPASGGQPGTIEVPLRNGTDATIHGLPTGNYAAQEWIPAGVDLNNVELSVYLQRAGRYANVTTFNDGTHQGYTLSSTGSGSTYYRVDSDVILVLTNTRKTQTVTITKTLVDPVVNSATFTFTGRLMDGPTDITSDIAGLSSFTITANTPVPGQPHTYTGTATFTLPAGAVLTVTESMTQAESELYEGTPATGSLTVSETAANNRLSFTNTRKSAKLTITKNVTGDMGDRSATNQFTFTLESVADETIGTTYTWTKTAVGGTTSSGTLTTTAGSNTFTLAHSESIVIELPLNKAVVISETNGLYTPSWSTSGGTVTLTNPGTSTVTATLTGDAHVTITNNLPAVAPTGLSFREAPYVWILGIGAVLVWSAVLLPKKKKEED